MVWLANGSRGIAALPLLALDASIRPRVPPRYGNLPRDGKPRRAAILQSHLRVTACFVGCNLGAMLVDHLAILKQRQAGPWMIQQLMKSIVGLCAKCNLQSGSHS
jgi:hypothetical protein